MQPEMGRVGRDWRRVLAGWRAVLRHAELPGYRDLGPLARLRLDAGLLAAAPGRAGFWRGLLWVSAGGLLGRILAWRLDVADAWPGDVLTLGPIFLALPAVARARQRFIRQSLRGRLRPRGGKTDGPTP